MYHDSIRQINSNLTMFTEALERGDNTVARIMLYKGFELLSGLLNQNKERVDDIDTILNDVHDAVEHTIIAAKDHEENAISEFAEILAAFYDLVGCLSDRVIQEKTNLDLARATKVPSTSDADDKREIERLTKILKSIEKALGADSGMAIVAVNKLLGHLANSQGYETKYLQEQAKVTNLSTKNQDLTNENKRLKQFGDPKELKTKLSDKSSQLTTAKQTIKKIESKSSLVSQELDRLKKEPTMVSHYYTTGVSGEQDYAVIEIKGPTATFGFTTDIPSIDNSIPFSLMVASTSGVSLSMEFNRLGLGILPSSYPFLEDLPADIHKKIHETFMTLLQDRRYKTSLTGFIHETIRSFKTLKMKELKKDGTADKEHVERLVNTKIRTIWEIFLIGKQGVIEKITQANGCDEVSAADTYKYILDYSMSIFQQLDEKMGDYV